MVCFAYGASFFFWLFFFVLGVFGCEGGYIWDRSSMIN
jgi:hypothetical protein